MQRYEASLMHSSQSVLPAPAGATVAAAYGPDGQTMTSGYVGAGSAGGGLGRGVPWNQLVGANPTNGVAADLRAGIGALDATQTEAMSELAAARAASSGLMPGVGARGQGQPDKEHKNRMPTIDQKLFAVDGQACVPVIGL